MSTRAPHYTAQETSDKGDEIYEHKIRADVEDGNRGKVVAIDVESEAFEIGENAIQASDRLLARKPEAEIWFVRIGHRSLHRIGAQAHSREP